MAGKCHIAEVASFELDQSLATNVVPPTTFVNLAPNRWKRGYTPTLYGSLQVFVPNVIEAKEFFDYDPLAKEIETAIDSLPTTGAGLPDLGSKEAKDELYPKLFEAYERLSALGISDEQLNLD